ncbi:nucleoside phosphorylase [candidate division WOR-3 bacterium]|nr:nucleoside phosphorylase [candidate division WOR-3 bacterium]
MDKNNLPLLYGKPEHRSAVNPEDFVNFIKKTRRHKIPRVSKYCLLSFKYMKALESLKRRFKIEAFDLWRYSKLYLFNYKDIEVSFINLGVGAPLAGMMLEELIALGCEYIIFFGGVGVLDPEIKRGDLIVPIRALRDEGTSFHYEPPSRYSYPSKLVVNVAKETLNNENLKYFEGTTWTTDAPYRETYEKVNEFKKEEVLCIEMEASALFSIAHFRKKHIGALFSASDLVGGEKWDPRREKGDKGEVAFERARLLDCSLKALYNLYKKKLKV